MRKVFLVSLVVFLSLLAAFAATADPGPSWKVLPLGEFWGTAINNRGQIAGHTRGHASVWYRGHVRPIEIDADFSTALDINDHGTILISATWSKPARQGHYLVHSDGLIQKVDIPHGDTVHNLNNLNQVVGETYDSNTRVQAGFIWANCKMTLLTDRGMCTMVDINNHGIATGFLWGMGGYEEPFVWANDQLNVLPAPGDSRPTDINDHGQTSGYYGLEWGQWFPVVWEKNGAMRQLSDWHGKASCVNNRGDILGYVDPPSELYQVVLWRHDGTMTPLEANLDRPLRILSSPLGMNDKGQVVCFGIEPNGKSGYYFLQPRQ